MPRQRDYAAEYARRRALHPESVTVARGHKSREYEQAQRAVNRLISNTGVRVDAQGNIIRRAYGQGNRPNTKGFIDRAGGPEKVMDAIRLMKEAEKAYESGDRDRARLLWMQRDRDLPEWMFWYHGVFG